MKAKCPGVPSRHLRLEQEQALAERERERERERDITRESMSITGRETGVCVC